MATAMRCDRFGLGNAAAEGVGRPEYHWLADLTVELNVTKVIAAT